MSEPNPILDHLQNELRAVNERLIGVQSNLYEMGETRIAMLNQRLMLMNQIQQVKKDVPKE